MAAQPDCYGKMFPPVSPAAHGREMRGKVFSYRINVPGMAVTSREVGFDGEAWRQCLACPECDGCFRLSTGLLLLDSSVQH